MNTKDLLNKFPTGITFQELYAAASSLAKEGQREEAEQIFQFLIRGRDKIHPHYIGASFFKLGEIAGNRNDTEKANSYFHQCLEYNPHHLRAAAYLGLNREILRDWENLRLEITALPGHLPPGTIGKIDSLYTKNFLLEEEEKKEAERLFMVLVKHLESIRQFQLSKKAALFFLRILMHSKPLVSHIKGLILKKANSKINGKYLVSIVIPYYNGHDTVKETLDSIAGQTYRNFEVIIVDNGSTESSRRNLEALLTQYPDMSIILPGVEKRRKGPRRNLGVEKANGEFILPLDCDDQIAPVYLEHTLEEFEADNSLDLVYTETIVFGLINELWVTRDFSIPGIFQKNQLNATALMKKKSFLRVGGYREELPGYEDWDLWIRFAMKRMRFKRIPEPLFFYRKSRSSRGFRSRHRDLEKRLALIEKNPGIYRLPEAPEIPILQQNPHYIPTIFLKGVGDPSPEG
jgi:tetratricopeptide (TPR) repeat protein